MKVAGMMGMSEKEFFATTPRYFLLRKKGWEEAHIQQAYEVARYIAFFTLVAPHVKKGALKNVQDVGKFPWELEYKKLTDEQYRLLREQVKRDWEDFQKECQALEN